MISLTKGVTYIFDQSHSSNLTHPLYISLNSDGTHSGGSQYRNIHQEVLVVKLLGLFHHIFHLVQYIFIVQFMIEWEVTLVALQYHHHHHNLITIINNHKFI